MAKHETLKNHIESLRTSLPELKGVLLGSNEGLPIAHSLAGGIDPNRLAAMAAAANSVGKKINDQLSLGTLGEVSVQCEDGALFVYAAGNKAVLVVYGPKGANAGLIHLESRGVAEAIGSLF